MLCNEQRAIKDAKIMKSSITFADFKIIIIELRCNSFRGYLFLTNLYQVADEFGTRVIFEFLCIYFTLL